MTLTNQIALTVLSAVTLALGIPNELFLSGSPFFGLIALIPLYKAVNSSKSLKNAALILFIHGFVTHAASSFWLAYFKDFAIFTLGASTLGNAAIKAFTSLFYYLPLFMIKNHRDLYAQKRSLWNAVNSKGFKVFWFAMCYTLWETLKSTGFLAYPWGTVYMSAYNMRLLCQVTRLAGTPLITFIFAFFAGTAAEFMDSSCMMDIKKAFNVNRNLISCTLIIFILSTVYGVWAVSRKLEQTAGLNTVLIQQNLDPWKSNDDTDSILTSQMLTEKALKENKEKGINTDLVVWSEGILRMPFPEGKYYYRDVPASNPLIPFMAKKKVPFIIGGALTLNAEKLEFCNSAIVFNKNGGVMGYYNKRHLVPFAESLPFTDIDFVKNLMDKYLGFSFGWTAGKEYTLFDIPADNGTVKISIPICFEDAFGELCGDLKNLGSQIFMNITDDSWSLTKSAEYQHYVLAWFRAVELETTLVRSTNSGCTVVIDPKGNVLYDLPLFEEGYLNCRVPVYESKGTVYQIWGSWFVRLLRIIFDLALALCVFIHNREFLISFFNKIQSKSR
ncbi:MAG: apolipoprotein N-acyltransferase [Treponema sp.]|nr:apolipoprotein N-acyltransferase [Treponema sp.]